MSSEPVPSLPQPPADPPQLAPQSQLPAMDQSANGAGGSGNIQGGEKCPLTSWFAIRVVHEPVPGGEEESVDGLTLKMKLSNANDETRVTSKDTDINKVDSLAPGGTCEVVSTDHSDCVWEVEVDIP